MKNMKKQIRMTAVFLTLLICGALLAACGGETTEDTINVGYLVHITGDLSLIHI